MLDTRLNLGRNLLFEASIKLVVLTRFATRLAPELPPPSRSWVESRFDLFERYCLASMRANCQDGYLWLLLVDPELPADLLQRIADYEREFTQIRVLPVASFSDRDTIAAHIASTLTTADTAVLTTRLDSDDAVSVDFIERLRAAAACVPPAEKRVIVFSHGYELKGSRLYWRIFPRSPFASLLEPIGAAAELQTILNADHEDVDALAPVTVLGAPPAWIQVIHGGNVLNRVRGLRAPRARLLGRFAVNDAALETPESIVQFVIGWIYSVIRLAGLIIATPRYWAKVGEVLGVRKRPT
jgi:hypothetical protein